MERADCPICELKPTYRSLSSQTSPNVSQPSLPPRAPMRHAVLAAAPIAYELGHLRSVHAGDSVAIIGSTPALVSLWEAEDDDDVRGPNLNPLDQRADDLTLHC